MKCSASLSFAAGRIRRGGLAISSRRRQDARANFMNERYLKWNTLPLSINDGLDDGRWCGRDWNYWHDMLPYHSSLL
jgi:hypothetical protein